jgi:hypothetical protein
MRAPTITRYLNSPRNIGLPKDITRVKVSPRPKSLELVREIRYQHRRMMSAPSPRDVVSDSKVSHADTHEDEGWIPIMLCVDSPPEAQREEKVDSDSESETDSIFEAPVCISGYERSRTPPSTYVSPLFGRQRYRKNYQSMWENCPGESKERAKKWLKSWRLILESALLKCA